MSCLAMLRACVIIAADNHGKGGPPCLSMNTNAEIATKDSKYSKKSMRTTKISAAQSVRRISPNVSCPPFAQEPEKALQGAPAILRRDIAEVAARESGTP
jgi:hypothetical protein